MQRRKFLSAALAASALPLSCAASNKIVANNNMAAEKELYEIRTYEMKFGSNQKLLLDYLRNALKPALIRAGVNHFMLFDEIAPGGPKKYYVLISYPTTAAYIQAQNLSGDSTYISAASAYNAVEKAIYNRYESWLLHAFDGFPKMVDPKADSTIFELRTYEGYSDDAVRRKIKMFNEEEFPLFIEVGLHPLFFGEMIAGPYRPCLTYMINCKDMEAHGAGWKAFLNHPDWNVMKVKPKYQNTVSNIRNVFLKVV